MSALWEEGGLHSVFEGTSSGFRPRTSSGYCFRPYHDKMFIHFIPKVLFEQVLYARNVLGTADEQSVKMLALLVHVSPRLRTDRQCGKMTRCFQAGLGAVKTVNGVTG